MNTHFNRFIGFSAIFFAIGSSAFAGTNSCPSKKTLSCFKQGYGLCDDRIPAAYNASARIDVQNKWDFFLTGSFIYWQADQEGMDLAYPQGLVTLVPSHDNMQIQKFEFKPGFKVGLGMDFDYDNWIGSLEYTWFHQQTHMSKRSPADRHWQMTDWFADTHGTSFTSTWRAHLDILDASLSRPYYQGRNITITPFGGVRAAWISQNLHIATDGIDGSWVSYNHSHRWSTGPRAGLQARWLLGWGFRMEGDCSGSVLFTRYTNVAHKEVDSHGDTRYSLHYRDYNTFRPMADMKVGLGWGSYLDHQNYHLDLLATYDFNIIWAENMMRALSSLYISGTAFEPADLHLQGLTVTARFDF